MSKPSTKTRSTKQTVAEVEAKLKAERIQDLLKALPGWRLSPGRQSISRIFDFRQPEPANAFLEMVSRLAAQRGHYPVLRVRQGRVTCSIGTTLERGLTLQDFELANEISLQA